MASLSGLLSLFRRWACERPLSAAPRHELMLDEVVPAEAAFPLFTRR